MRPRPEHGLRHRGHALPRREDRLEAGHHMPTGTTTRRSTPPRAGRIGERGDDVAQEPWPAEVLASTPAPRAGAPGLPARSCSGEARESPCGLRALGQGRAAAHVVADERERSDRRGWPEIDADLEAATSGRPARAASPAAGHIARSAASRAALEERRTRARRRGNGPASRGKASRREWGSAHPAHARQRPARCRFGTLPTSPRRRPALYLKNGIGGLCVSRLSRAGFLDVVTPASDLRTVRTGLNPSMIARERRSPGSNGHHERAQVVS